MSRSMGPVTVGVSHVVQAVSVGFYRATSTAKDSPRSGGHRTFTHTALAAVLAAVGVSVLCGSFGSWAVAGTLFFTLSLAIRGLLRRRAKKTGWIGVVAASAGLTWAAIHLAGGQAFGWLGVMVGFGMLLHDVGDMVTKEGAPLLPYRGQAWHDWGVPSFLRVRAGGTFEYGLLLPALTVVTVLAAVRLVVPGVLP